MNKDGLIMQEDTLDPIAFAVIDNSEKHYYHQYTKATSTREFHKAIIK